MVSGLAQEIKYKIDDLDEYFHDAKDLEFLLSKAIHALFLNQPDGEVNYGEENPKVGRIWPSRANARTKGTLILQYSPSVYYQERFKYTLGGLANINLRKKTYSLYWQRHGLDYERLNENFWLIPKVVMKDTEKVIDLLGLQNELVVISSEQ